MRQFRPGNFQILPLIIKNLLIINVLIFLAQTTFDQRGMGDQITDFFALHHLQSPYFKPHQVISHLFMHGSWEHLFFNMFALWMFGSVLENLWGPKRFLVFYVVSGIGAAAIHIGVLAYEYHHLATDAYRFVQNPTLEGYQQYYLEHLQQSFSDAGLDARKILLAWESNPENAYMYQPLAAQTIASRLEIFNMSATVGASGAVFGCLAAFGYLFPNSYIYLYFLVPIKVKWFVLGYAAMELFLAIRNSAGDQVAHWAHLGGALAGFLMVYFWNRTNRRNFY